MEYKAEKRPWGIVHTVTSRSITDQWIEGNDGYTEHVGLASDTVADEVARRGVNVQP